MHAACRTAVSHDPFLPNSPPCPTFPHFQVLEPGTSWAAWGGRRGGRRCPPVSGQRRLMLPPPPPLARMRVCVCACAAVCERACVRKYKAECGSVWICVYAVTNTSKSFKPGFACVQLCVCAVVSVVCVLSVLCVCVWLAVCWGGVL
jgi:hypothetical protein